LALDHYVAQVHLRQFYSPALVNLMYATKKSDLKSFPCNSASVCRLEENSTNLYLTKPRLIEDFLHHVEPKYSASLKKLRGGNIDQECVLAVSGFAAFISCCAPAASRSRIPSFREGVETATIILDRQGKLPKAPPELDGRTITELLDEGAIKIHIDPKYPQAIGISNIIRQVGVWGNSCWEILLNEDSKSPYFTSDYPIALEAQNAFFANWIVPLAPDLAIRIIPDLRQRGVEPDLSFSNFKFRRRRPSRQELHEINRLIVRSAEDLVFYRDALDWIPDFIAKNRHYRIETVIDRLPYPTGFLSRSTHRIVHHTKPEIGGAEPRGKLP
jgi:hypothetical protein